MTTPATQQKRQDLLTFIEQELAPHPAVQAVIGVGSIASGMARPDSDIDAVVFLDPFGPYIIPAEFIWRPSDRTFHSIFNQDLEVQETGIQFDFARYDLRQWADPDYEWPEAVRSGLREGWIAFDRSGRIVDLITEHTAYKAAIRIARLDEALVELDLCLKWDDPQALWAHLGPAPALDRLQVAYDALAAALFAYNRRWRPHRNREMTHLLKLAWLPPNFEEHVLVALNAPSLNYGGYLQRFETLKRLFDAVLAQLIADGDYEEDAVSQAFIRAHDEPGRAWNMDEWNRKHDQEQSILRSTQMTPVTSRPYRDAADLQAMTGLIRRRPAERAADYPGIGDVQQRMGTRHGRTHTQLWEDSDRMLIGFTIVEPRYNTMWFEIVADQQGSSIESDMIAWGEQQMRQTAQVADEPAVLRISCRDNHLTRIARLERHGYSAQPVRTLHMDRSLQEPIPEPQLPLGFVIRPVAGKHEADALTALHRAAFGTQNLTVDDRLSWMRMPEYEPELDLVVVAPDGALAAYCRCGISIEENTLVGRNAGYTDPIATHPEFRRRGLAHALLLTGMHRLRERGMESAILSTWGENVAMQKTAQSVGFQVTATTIYFMKELPSVGRKNV